ncbi:MAG: methyltransferase domain-containing protein [Alphaproteobacteria bacterium]|nr:methyltransferase domain-containing protein [Alphaproteobacteria bacterium]
MNGPPKIFDRKLYAYRRQRALGTDFLVREAAMQIAERLGTVNRKFERGLDLCSRATAFELFSGAARSWIRMRLAGLEGDLVGDEEALPFAKRSFDVIISVLSLHAVNDLPGTLLQVRAALAPDGLFMAAMLGGETLKELREAFATAEAEILGGASPRVAPFADLRDLGALLQRAGFALPVTDIERTIARYQDFSGLVRDLRALGETNVLVGRRPTLLRRDVLSATAAEYGRLLHNARIPATFDTIYLAGWAAR